MVTKRGAVETQAAAERAEAARRARFAPPSPRRDAQRSCRTVAEPAPRAAAKESRAQHGPQPASRCVHRWRRCDRRCAARATPPTRSPLPAAPADSAARRPRGCRDSGAAPAPPPAPKPGQILSGPRQPLPPGLGEHAPQPRVRRCRAPQPHAHGRAHPQRGPSLAEPCPMPHARPARPAPRPPVFQRRALALAPGLRLHRPRCPARRSQLQRAARIGRRQSAASAGETESGGTAGRASGGSAASRYGGEAGASARCPALRRRRGRECRPPSGESRCRAVRFIPVRFVRASR